MADKRFCGVCAQKGHTSQECPRVTGGSMVNDPQWGMVKGDAPAIDGQVRVLSRVIEHCPTCADRDHIADEASAYHAALIEMTQERDALLAEVANLKRQLAAVTPVTEIAPGVTEIVTKKRGRPATGRTGADRQRAYRERNRG